MHNTNVSFYRPLYRSSYARKVVLIGIIGVCSLAALGQEVTIDECQEWARKSYPAVARYDLIERTKEYSIANANRAYLPQGSFSAQASWQSDVTRIDLDLPEGIPPIEIPVPDRDQYRAAVELNQLIWDGGLVSSQKRSLEANAELEMQQLETEIYRLQERVNQVFFGILLMKANLHQQGIFENELQRNLDNVRAYVEIQNFENSGQPARGFVSRRSLGV